MVVMAFHDDHRIGGQLTGLTRSIRDESNRTDETTPKTSPRSIHITTRIAEPFNATNNTSDGYKTICTNR